MPPLNTEAGQAWLRREIAAIKWEFRKVRLRTPANADQFQPIVIKPGEDWSVETAPKAGAARRKGNSQVVERLVDAAIAIRARRSF